jgi:GcrA cell cycle regulator
MTDWTEVNENLLTEMWAAGYSSRSIAEFLQTTRNAIIGKAHRLKLPVPDYKLPVPVMAGARREHTRRPNPEPQRKPSKPMPHKPNLSELPAAPVLRRTLSPNHFIIENGRVQDLPNEHPFSEVPFLKRKRRQCAWPTSGSGTEMWCCGAKAMGKESYCADHYYRSVRVA